MTHFTFATGTNAAVTATLVIGSMGQTNAVVTSILLLLHRTTEWFRKVKHDHAYIYIYIPYLGSA